MPIIGYSSRCFAAAVPGATRHKLRTTEHTRPADLRPLNYGLATAQNRATRDDANVDDKLLKEEQEKKKKAGTRHKRLLNEPSSGRSTDGQWPMPVVLVSTRPGDLAISKPAPPPTDYVRRRASDFSAARSVLGIMRWSSSAPGQLNLSR